jgi:hypothetical protein
VSISTLAKPGGSRNIMFLPRTTLAYFSGVLQVSRPRKPPSGSQFSLLPRPRHSFIPKFLGLTIRLSSLRSSPGRTDSFWTRIPRVQMLMAITQTTKAATKGQKGFCVFFSWSGLYPKKLTLCLSLDKSVPSLWSSSRPVRLALFSPELLLSNASVAPY